MVTDLAARPLPSWCSTNAPSWQMGLRPAEDSSPGKVKLAELRERLSTSSGLDPFPPLLAVLASVPPSVASCVVAEDTG